MKIVCLLTFFINFAISTKTNFNLPRVGKITRIIGGSNARAGEWPWVAAIYKNTADGRYFCAGTLIHELFILTAAQCVYQATGLTIQLGSNQLNGEDDNRMLLSSSMYIIHDQFDPSVSSVDKPMLAHDIAMIKLHLPIQFSDYIKPVKYASIGDVYTGQVVDAIGWGQVSDTDSGLINDLQVVNVTLISDTNCELYYGKEQIYETMICAEGSYNEGICYGDVGGALFTPPSPFNETVAVAIGSFISQNGCESLDPTGYTRIDSYSGWITMVIKIDGGGENFSAKMVKI